MGTMADSIEMSEDGTATPLEDEATPLDPSTPTIDEDTRDLDTPTQDDIGVPTLPRLTAEVISSLAPGMSATGIEAAASILQGIPLATILKPNVSGGGVDEISDDEFDDDNVGENLTASSADKPVDDNMEAAREEQRSRLSNVSSTSNASLNKAYREAVDDDEELSLSGLSSEDGDRLHTRSDLEDGEIQSKNGPKEVSEANGLVKEAAAPALSSDSSADEGGGGAKKRRFRKRSEQRSDRSAKDSISSKSEVSDEDNDLRRSSPRPSSLVQKRKQELPRYDVRNVINRKKASRKDRSRSPTRNSRSPRRNSRSPKIVSRLSPKRFSRSPKRLSRSPKKLSRSPRRLSSWSSPMMNNSRSPPRKSLKNRRSRSPLLGRSRSRSRRMNKSRSPSPRTRNKRPNIRWRPKSRSWSRSRSRTPPSRFAKKRRADRSVTPVKINKKKNGSSISKKKQQPRLRSRTPSRSRSRKKKSPIRTTTKKGNKKVSKKNRVVLDEDLNSSPPPLRSSLVSTKKTKKAAKKAKKRSSQQHDIFLSNSSSVADKEVFASGDKIMVSVNFKNTKSAAVEAAAFKKPCVIIDVMSSPYQVIENSPQPIIDVLSEDDEANCIEAALEAAEADKVVVAAMEPMEDTAANNIDQQTEAVVSTHRGPCTPPPMSENLDLARGPQTPTENPMDSYDPCNPTESPGDLNNEPLLRSGSSASSSSNKDEYSLLKSAANTIPFLMEDSLIQRLESGVGGGKSGGVQNNNSSSLIEAVNSNGNNNDSNDLPVDMDMDSPFSPQSSELSDIFEPPSLTTPLTNKKMGKRGHSSKANGTGHRGHHGKSGKFGKSSKSIHMRVIEDKLRIIDDVPTSAVEMAVKEKFLKKVQRQERIVEEIKTVLKPYYNRKRINKEDYKDILRKCVPKVCHNKNGEINPTKIQKLVKGYIRKYHHNKKKPFV